MDLARLCTFFSQSPGRADIRAGFRGNDAAALSQCNKQGLSPSKIGDCCIACASFSKGAWNPNHLWDNLIFGSPLKTIKLFLPGYGGGSLLEYWANTKQLVKAVMDSDGLTITLTDPLERLDRKQKVELTALKLKSQQGVK